MSPDRPRRYSVALTTWANTAVVVEASSPDEAKRLAEESGEFPTLCHQCSGYGHGPSLEIGDEWNAVEASVIEDDPS